MNNRRIRIPRTPTTPSRNNGLSCPLFILDVSIMVDLINNVNISNPLLVEILKRKSTGMPMKVVTTSAAFARAINLSNNNTRLSNVRLILSFVEITHSTADFRDEEAVNNEITRLFRIMSEGAL